MVLRSAVDIALAGDGVVENSLDNVVKSLDKKPRFRLPGGISRILAAGVFSIGMGIFGTLNAATNVDGFVWDSNQVGIDSALVQFTEVNNPSNVYSTFTKADGDSTGFYKLKVGEDVGIDDKPDYYSPESFRLYHNYPNPFIPLTTIKFAIPVSTKVSLKVYNLRGHEIADLVNKEMSRGVHEINWDGKDRYGRIAADGVYIYQLIAGNYSDAKKMLVMKGAHTSAGRNSANRSLGKQTVCFDGVMYQMDVTKEGIIYPVQQMVELEQDTTINVAVERILRQMHGQITDFFTHQPVESVKVVSNIDSALTDANGNYSVLVTGREYHIPIIGPNNQYLRSGVILQPGTIDTLFNWTIARGDSAQGIDSTYFRDYILKNRFGVPDFVYVSPKEESVPDTAYIAGNIDWLSLADGFRNVAQLNKIGEKINVMADSVTRGLYNINRTTIVIADSNFTHPDSVALFAYLNMVAVGNEEFPSTVEELKNYLTILGADSFLGGNGTFYEENGLTIKGHGLILGNYLRPGELGAIFNTEFCSSILGGVETPAGYPSVFGPGGATIFPQDYRTMWFILDRGPGRVYPDLPKGFDNPFVIIPRINKK